MEVWSHGGHNGYYGGDIIALEADGSVVTWEHNGYGGDSSAVQAELKQGVDHIYSTDRAFAATKTDGSVVTPNSMVSNENRFESLLVANVTIRAHSNRVCSDSYFFYFFNTSKSHVPWKK
jgi:hypothetical protein